MYPLTFNVDYPEGSRNRLTTLFRLILMIPIAIVIGLLIPMAGPAIVLMLLFRGKYPRWWFDFNLEWLRFNARVDAYLLLLRDEYPSTDEEQAVHLDIAYPEPGSLNRFLPLIKWLLALPHWIIIYILGIIALVVTVIGWLLIIVTGSYPRAMFDFVVGVTRWTLRVEAYAVGLFTDQYPLFRLGE